MSAMTPLVLDIRNLSKSFQLHLQGNTTLPVFKELNLQVRAGECVVLHGVSGMGKSSLLKCIYGNYKPNEGSIALHFKDGEIDLATCSPQWIHAVRQHTVAYVSQFLRVVPRVPALQVVAQPLLDAGTPKDEAERAAGELLERLHIAPSLWQLSPTTFSGGEQQRINIARSFIRHYPVMLLDEPTASLDAKNRAVVLELIQEAKRAGSAMIGIFHDEETRNQVADRMLELQQFAA